MPTSDLRAEEVWYKGSHFAVNGITFLPHHMATPLHFGPGSQQRVRSSAGWPGFSHTYLSSFQDEYPFSCHGCAPLFVGHMKCSYPILSSLPVVIALSIPNIHAKHVTIHSGNRSEPILARRLSVRQCSTPPPWAKKPSPSCESLSRKRSPWYPRKSC